MLLPDGHACPAVSFLGRVVKSGPGRLRCNRRDVACQASALRRRRSDDGPGAGRLRRRRGDDPRMPANRALEATVLLIRKQLTWAPFDEMRRTNCDQKTDEQTLTRHQRTEHRDRATDPTRAAAQGTTHKVAPGKPVITRRFNWPLRSTWSAPANPLVRHGQLSHMNSRLPKLTFIMIYYICSIQLNPKSR